jgi:two-component system sensor histidine kinase KdpD
MRAHVVRSLVCVVAIAAMTGVVALLRPIAPDISLGALYTVVVLGAAVAYGMPYALGVSGLSLLTFDFFILPPVRTLSLADVRNWTALVVYLVTGVVASELAAAARRRARQAETREREAALLADLAAVLLERRDPAELLELVDLGNVRLVAAVESLEAIAAERERLQREALEAEALRRSDEVKTAVLRSVSHDLRTPLAAIEAALDGLESASVRLGESDRAALLETVRMEHTRLRRLVENLLDLSRLQAGAAAAAPALWTVDALVAQSLDALPDAERVEVALSAELPALRVDAVQIERALANVIENALRFSPSDEPVEVRAEAWGSDLVIRVDDRGRGLDAAEAEAVFEPFHRGAQGGGAGLGLAIARGFVTANGGRLWAEPRAGGGASFMLAFPAEEIPAAVRG